LADRESRLSVNEDWLENRRWKFKWCACHRITA